MDRLDTQEARWFALRTASRREKVAQKLLARDGVEVYLPLQQVKRRYHRKIVSRELCLLPSYLFVHICRAEAKFVHENPYTNFVRIGPTRLDIPQRDIDLMRQITGEDLVWEPIAQDDWKKNDPVELLGGNFTGLQGYFIERKNKKEFVISIESLGLLGMGHLVATVDSRYVVRRLAQ